MLSRVPSYQRGLTFIGFFVACVLVGFVALVVMKLFPLYNESFKVRAALKAIASQPEIAQKTAYEIRTLVMRNFAVSDVDRFTDATLKNALSVKRDPSGKQRLVRMAYEARAPLFGNLDAVLKIDESITIAGAATE
jgi:DMSO reductase anchor subunit